MFASTALVVAWTAVDRTSYGDHLAGFCEWLSPPYRCYTVLKNV